MNIAETVLKALEDRFLESGEPNQLTEVHPWFYGGPPETGLNRWAHPGFLKRIIGSTFILPGLADEAPINDLILRNEVEAYCWPANAILQWLRAVGAKRPGFATEVGIGTMVDPRNNGTKFNDAAVDDVVSLETLGGRDVVMYDSFPVDVALIRGTTADEEGNISMEEEGLTHGVLAQAIAARNSGGIVIAQVKRRVMTASLHPMMVQVPGVLVDYVVVNEEQKQWEYGILSGDLPATMGEYRVPLGDIEFLPFSEKKIMGRRALMETRPGQIVNIGSGTPYQILPNLIEEELVSDKFLPTIEHGALGGRVLGSAHWNVHAIVDQPSLLDWYNGGGIDVSVLGFGEVDRFGNVNVGRMGPTIPGVGGFVDIAASTKNLVFCGPFMRGAEIGLTGTGIEIRREGWACKFVESTDYICFSAQRGAESGQRVIYVTERAVFELRSGKITVIEIAPGVDVKRDVLEHIPFDVDVAPDVRSMDVRLFAAEPMFLGLDESWLRSRDLVAV